MNAESLHLTYEQIVDLTEQRINEAEEEKVKKHLAACSLCAMEKFRLERTFEVIYSDETEDVPQYLSERLFDLIARRKQHIKTTKQPSPLEKILATLSFDSSRMSPAFVRSGTPSAERQLFYAFNDCEVDLRLKQNEDKWSIYGQVLGWFMGGEAELKSDFHTFKSELNDLCEFTFPSVAAGTYKLFFRLGRYEIELNKIEIEQ